MPMRHNLNSSMPAERGWLRLPRVIRIFLLLPVVLGIQVASILLLYPQMKLPEASFHDLLLLALLLIVSIGSADAPNRIHLEDLPAPYPSLARYMGALASLAFIAAFTWDVAWLYTYWPTPDEIGLYGWNRGAYFLAASAIVIAIGACEA